MKKYLKCKPFSLLNAEYCPNVVVEAVFTCFQRRKCPSVGRCGREFIIARKWCSLHTGVWTKCRKGLDKPWIIIGQSLDEVLTNLGLIYSLSNYYPGFVHNPILIQPLSSVNHQVIQPMSNVYQCPIIIQSLSRVHLGIIHSLSSNFPLF